MTLPLQVTFRNVPLPDRVEAVVRRRAAQLDRYYDAIMSCRVLVERADRHHADGSRFHVRVELGVPGGEVVVSHDSSLHGGARRTGRPRERKEDEIDRAHKHAEVAVRKAFDAVRRRLQDFARRQRGDIKEHQALGG